MNLRSERQEPAVVRHLDRRNEAAFEKVFRDHFKGMNAYAATILKDDFFAEEVVQQVFFKLWERGGTLEINGSPASYLYRAVHNECMNHLKHKQVKAKHHLHVVAQSRAPERMSIPAETRELEECLREGLEALPEQCRTIFQLSRFEDLKYREIAEKLSISIKTVENQVGKALKLLRERMIEFMTCLIFIHLF